ncbi:MAG: adenylate/guanylate cyclase domain-containing protein [Rhodospirillales bacterium]|nr:adenylate/guanylate cyclase domain-containing protein [Rhodospirillales bacterium]
MGLAGKKVTFEVLAMQNGRWSMHGRYDNLERAAAMKEAETLDKQKGIGTVKVIKETYDPETDETNEVTVFQSAGAGVPSGGGKSKQSPPPQKKKEFSKKGTAKTQTKTSAPAEAPTGQQQAATQGGQAPKTSSMGLIGKILMIIVISIVVGTVLSAAGSLIVRNTDLLTGVISRNSYGTLLFAVFVLAFLFTGIIMAMMILNKEDLNAAPDLSHGVGSRDHSKQKHSHQKRSSSSSTVKDDGFYGEDAEDDGLDKEEDEEGYVYSDEEEEDGLDLDAEAEAIREAVKKESLKVEKLRDDLVAFLEEGINEIKAANVRLDKFNKFGLSLFLAGACDALGIEEGLKNNDRNEVLAELITMLGISKTQGVKFSKVYDSYLATDSRYLGMFKSGIDAMRSRIRSNEVSSVGLQMKNALDEWNKPKPKDPETGPVTVMFTDMVGSTALNQEKGDQVAQEVVRKHNRIVRSNLTIYNGKEIKHTGDGIMCSFSVSSSGVEAAAEIQKQILAESDPNEEELLKIRIGLHAGELIVEDNDLFGTTVQLAARICDRADTGEVFVSSTIQSICAGIANIDFFDEGQYELKGIDKPMTLYSIVYDELAEERRAARHAKEADEVGGKGKRIVEGEEDLEEETSETSTEENSDEASNPETDTDEDTSNSEDSTSDEKN